MTWMSLLEEKMKCRRLTLAALVATAISLPLSASAEQNTAGPNTNKTDHSAALQKPMMDSMQQMQSMPMTGDMDHDFVMMMREHHQSALDMAQAELEHGKDPKIRSMAKKIITSQKKEIAQFDQWLATHK